MRVSRPRPPCLTRWRTLSAPSAGSIWPAILCHAGVNTFNGVILPRYAEHAGVDMTNIEPEWTEVLLLLAVTLPLSAVVIWWLGERLLGGKEVAKQAAEN